MSRELSSGWSIPLAVTDVPHQGLDVTLAADEGVRKRLAELNNLANLSFVEAKLKVARRGREGLHVTGELRARATQSCVVTLEPFETEIVEPIDVEFAPEAPPPRSAEPGRRTRARAPEPLDESEGMEDLDAPDPIIDGKIDLGALATEFLTLGLDPYPRKPGVAFDEPEAPADRETPFSKLARLKTRLP